MITMIEIDGATGNDEAPLLDLAAMLEDCASELKQAHEAKERCPVSLTTTDDGEVVMTLTVDPEE